VYNIIIKMLKQVGETMNIDNGSFYINIGLRLKEKREQKGYSYQELANLTGISKSSLQRYETGNTKKIPMEAITKLEDALSISRGYLMGWINEDELKGEIDKKTVSIRTELSLNTPLVFKEPKKEIFVDKKYPLSGDFSIIAPDDSMLKARIKKGDIVFIDSNQKATDGDIALILFNGSFLLRHAYYSAGYWTFSSAEVYDAPILSFDLEKDGITIMGKAVAFQSIL